MVKNAHTGGGKSDVRRCGEQKMGRVMSEFSRGTLRSSSGGIVRDRQQAIAIALSEKRRVCGGGGGGGGSAKRRGGSRPKQQQQQRRDGTPPPNRPRGRVEKRR